MSRVTDWQPEGSRAIGGAAINAKRLRHELEAAGRDGRRVILKLPNQSDRVVLHIEHRVFFNPFLALEC